MLPPGRGLVRKRGVAPPDTTLGDVFRAALPFAGLGLLAMALLIAFPAIILW